MNMKTSLTSALKATTIHFNLTISKESTSLRTEESNVKRKRKAIMVIVGIIAVIVLGFVIFLAVGLNLKDAVIKPIDISKIQDGTYKGELTGSRFANKLEVTVSGGKITDIKILKDMMVAIPNVSSKIFGEVIKNQSLQVDCVSGATVTSKAYLKALEEALD